MAKFYSSGGGSAIESVVEDTTPQLGGQLDVNGQALGDGTNELLKFSETASAVNEITVANAATGNNPQLQATGDDANVSINLVPKGSGTVQAGGNSVVHAGDKAVASDLNTGTSTAKVNTPDALAGSVFGEKTLVVAPFASSEAVTTGDGEIGLPITATLNGMDIVNVTAFVYDKGITGTTDVQIRRRRAGSNADVLSTKITIGDEFFATDEVINTSNDDLATGDMLFVDVDAIHSGTAPNGLTVAITCRLP